ncbi:MAG: hypothetical protein IH946_12745, partial [Bacteroidetes bacterium]|nr:hypothetical protein [Bacteroidota bacterium]
EKSKSAYKWSSNYDDYHYWIGFVGYEINYNGELRVRRKSLKKEKRKQKEVIMQILTAIKKSKRKKNGTIFESAMNRLIGMSVGRVDINNFKRIVNEMCWANGFIKLNNNKHLRMRLKGLDKYRANQISILLKELESIKMDKSKAKGVKIGKFSFAKLPNITLKDSEIIINELVANGILTSKFRLIKNIDMKDNNLDLKLSSKFIKREKEIIRQAVGLGNLGPVGTIIKSSSL